MKKKLVPLIMALVCAVVCTVSLAACGSKDNDPYYNKTYTLTGGAVIDWTSKDFADNYKYAMTNVSQKQILETYWDKIDWDRTLRHVENPPAHGSIDELIASFKDIEEKGYEPYAGLKFSFSGKDDLKLTLTLNEFFTDKLGLSAYYDAELTMPFAETPEQFEAIKPQTKYESPISYDGEGYYGAGVYEGKDDHVLVVEFYVEKYVKNLHITIRDVVVGTNYDGDGDASIIFQTADTAMTLYDADENVIINIKPYVGFNVTK